MARAQGARAQMALAWETTYGKAPTKDFTKVPFVSSALGAEQPLLTSDILGYGRAPQPPVQDAITVDGDIVVPVNAESIGFWLKAALGQPVKTGSAAPYKHAFPSESWALPSLSIEIGMPEVPRYAMYSGCMVDKIDWRMEHSGLMNATVSIIGRDEKTAATTQTGASLATLVPAHENRFGNFAGSISAHKSGTALDLASVVSVDLSYSNNLDRIETVCGGGRIAGADPSVAALTGSLVARFASMELMNIAVTGTSCALTIAWELPSGDKLSLAAPEIYLSRPRLEIQGPNGVQATFDWQGAANASSGKMLITTLQNKRGSAY